ncbi:MAG: DNA methyltransferase family protein, partial [Minisyncoccota bacterium]
MNEITTEQINAAQSYLKVATQLIYEGKNEQVVRDHFTSHLRTIFPSIPTWVTEHVLGGEAALKTRQKSKITTGFVDNLIGLTAIEYEGNLLNPAKFSEGYGQVRKYCASLANDGHDPSQIMGVLSDTVRWHAYRISIVGVTKGAVIETDNIELEEIESIDVSSATDLDARRLVEFLLKYLQRLGSRPLDASSITRDLGFESAFCERHLTMFSGVVADAFTSRPQYAELIKHLWCSFVDFVNARGATDTFNVNEYTRELYILTLGKLICANAIEGKSLLSNDSELSEILGGVFFKNRGLDNFIEYDYFGWFNDAGPLHTRILIVAKGIQQDLQAYDFQKISSEDIFGQLMAQLAERSQRILLGQEWTPTWLARALVQNTINKLPSGAQPRFVDMCCGSGAMILEMIRQTKQRIEANYGADISGTERIELLTQSITGFDIDPLAVMLSKISWVLAAKDWLIPLGTYRVTIPIYHADSLFAMTPLSREGTDGGQKIILKLAEHTLELPSFLVSTGWQGVFDAFIDRAYALAVQSDEPSLTRENISEIVEYSLQYAPAQIGENDKELLITFLSGLIDKIHILHKEGRNGIWAFILRNNYRPG